MSGGPSGAEGEGDITEKFHTFVNIDLVPEAWCSYYGGPEGCGINSLATERDYACLYCSFRKPINIPMKIKYALQEKEE